MYFDLSVSRYEKNPNKVTDKEFNILVKQDFNSKLEEFGEIWFLKFTN
jgi:hypothetical protein